MSKQEVFTFKPGNKTDYERLVNLFKEYSSSFEDTIIIFVGLYEEGGAKHPIYITNPEIKPNIEFQSGITVEVDESNYSGIEKAIKSNKLLELLL